MRVAVRLPMVFVVIGIAIPLTAGLGGCEKDQLQGAKAEVVKTDKKLDLPAPPAFDMPQPNPDGTHPAREMRLKGRKLLNTEVQVKGYITWIYDCAAELRKPEMTDADVQKLIEDDPTRCNRPHFYLGDTASTPENQTVWVVEIARPMREDEKKGLTRDDLMKAPMVPQYKVGDEVLVVGEWKQSSPHGFAKSEGLVVYKCLKNLTTPFRPDPKVKRPTDWPGGYPPEWPEACREAAAPPK
jgi:hypothetical protein